MGAQGVLDRPFRRFPTWAVAGAAFGAQLRLLGSAALLGLARGATPMVSVAAEECPGADGEAFVRILVHVPARAANARVPGGPTGPLGTPSRTPWTLSG